MLKVLSLKARRQEGRRGGAQSWMTWHPLKFGSLFFFSKALGLFSSFCSRPCVTDCALATILLNFWLYWINNVKPLPLLLVAHPVAVLRKSYFLALKRIKGLSHYKGGGDKLCLWEEFPGQCLQKLLSFLYVDRKPRGCFATGSFGPWRGRPVCFDVLESGSGPSWALGCLISSLAK